MQISTNYIFDRASQQMSTLQSDLAKSNAQIAAQKQVLNPSDAPDQTAAILRLKSVLGQQSSYTKSLGTVNARLSIESSALVSAGDVMTRIKEITIQAVSDTIGASGRQALGVQLQSLRNQLFTAANSTDSSGNYVFSGSRVGHPAFGQNSAGATVYQGDQTPLNVIVGENRTMPINRNGSDSFVGVVRTNTDGSTTGVGFFQVLDDLTKAINTNDVTTIRSSMAEVATLQQGLVLGAARVGTDQVSVDQQITAIQDTSMSLKSSLSSIEDLDFASAVVQMNKQVMSLQAAQSSFAKISQLSLFEYIK